MRTRVWRLILAGAVVALAVPAFPAAHAQAAPTLKVTPAAGLIDPTGDGAFVNVSWANVPPGTLVYLRQCAWHPTSVAQCSQQGYKGPALVTPGISAADGTGRWIFPVAVGLVNSLEYGDVGGPSKVSFTCDTQHACSIGMFLDDRGVDVHQAVFVKLTFGRDASSCPPATGATAAGTGASASFIAMLKWEGQVCRAPSNLSMQYTLKGSPEGRDDFVAGAADYSVVSEPFTTSQQSALTHAGVKYKYAPISASGLVFAYLLYDKTTGSQVTDLKMTPETLAGIFNGQIGNWNDPLIQATNPQYSSLPPVISAIGRGELSEETYEATSWFSKMADTEWLKAGLPFVAKGQPNPFAGGGTDIMPSTGVIGLVTGAEKEALAVARPSSNFDPFQYGWIGYMDASWARAYGLPTVKIQNAAGQFVDANPDSLGTAIKHMTVNPDGVTRSPNFDDTDPAAYPLPTINYLVARQNVTPGLVSGFDGSKGKVLSDFLTYVAGPGQSSLPPGYIPLPQDLKQATLSAAAGIPTADPPGSPTSTPSPTPTGSSTTGGSTTIPSGSSLPASPPATGGPSLLPPPTVVPLKITTVPAGLVLPFGARLMIPTMALVGVVGLLVGLALVWVGRRQARSSRRRATTPPAVPEV